MHTYVPNGDAIPVGHTRPTAISRLNQDFPLGFEMITRLFLRVFSVD